MKRFIWLLSAFLAVGTPAVAQSDARQSLPWRQISASLPEVQASPLIPRLNNVRAWRLDKATFVNSFANTPLDNGNGYAGFPAQILLPRPDGKLERFAAIEQPILSTELQLENPEVHTYYIQGLDDRTKTGRIAFTSSGFTGQVLGGDGDYYIDPVNNQDPSFYTSYWRKDLKPRGINCLVTDFDQADLKDTLGDGGIGAFTATGNTLKTYRLAMSCTGEYAAYHGGTVALAQNAILVSVNRVNGVYERDFAIRMNIVRYNVYTNAGTDPFTNSNGSTMLSQNQTVCDANPGTANYDIGHVFSTGGGGVAYLAAVGNPAIKAGGVTGSPAPIGDAFDIDYVAHEMGHQFGGNHSFNGTVGSCGGGNRNATTAFEPGSGISIMGYAGICGTNDLFSNSEAYFHAGNYPEMLAVRTAQGSSSSNGNSIPVVSAIATQTIPVNTPFILTTTATDADGDALTYSWDQVNAGAPLFRPYNPTTTNYRVFPKLSTVLAGLTTTPNSYNASYTAYEVLPSTARTMTFRALVRDNRAGGGGTDWQDASVVVTGAAFSLAGPNSVGTTWNAGASQAVTWTVGGANAGDLMDIYLSKNAGTDFFASGPVLIATGLPNNGSANVVVPYIQTTTARILIRPQGKIYFDANNANFSIEASTRVALSASPSPIRAGQSSTGTVTLTGVAPLGGLTLALSDNSATVTVPATVTVAANTSVATFPITTSANAATQNVTITATGDGYAKTANLTVNANTAPTASANSYTTNYQTPLTVAANGVLGNDSDPQNDALTAILVANVSHGTLSLNPNGGFTYTPASGYTGPDSFTYKANDGVFDSNTVTVSLTVNATPQLIGTVDLQQYNPGEAGIPVVIQLRQPSTTNVLYTLNATLNGAGQFTVSTSGVTLGTYDVAVKASHWLRNKTNNVVITAGTVNAPSISLVNGDVDGDNVVSIFDYIRLSDAFDKSTGDPGFDAEADLDGDGVVSIFDYIILSDHFDQEGV